MYNRHLNVAKSYPEHHQSTKRQACVLVDDDFTSSYHSQRMPSVGFTLPRSASRPNPEFRGHRVP